MQPHDSQNELSVEDRTLESALSLLTPVAPALDARSVHYHAERLRMAWRMRAYRAVAAVLAVALLLSLLTRPRPTPMSRAVGGRLTPAPPPPQSIAERNALAQPPLAMVEEFRDCRAIAENGLSALPAAPPVAAYAPRQELPLDPDLLSK
jgi:hypothetical protein